MKKNQLATTSITILTIIMFAGASFAALGLKYTIPGAAFRGVNREAIPNIYIDIYGRAYNLSTTSMFRAIAPLPRRSSTGATTLSATIYYTDNNTTANRYISCRLHNVTHHSEAWKYSNSVQSADGSGSMTVSISNPYDNTTALLYCGIAQKTSTAYSYINQILFTEN